MDTVMEKLIDAGFEYLKDQVSWPTGMKEELQRLRDIHPKIQAVVAYASTQANIRDQNPALDKWLWQLRDAIDEADDVFDDLEYKKHEEQLAKNKEKEEQLTGNMEETKKRKFSCITSFIYESACKIRKVGERALKIDPNLKTLEEVVQKLDKVSAGVDTFIHLAKDAKQEQQERQEELYRTRETGSLPKNDEIGRAKEKDFILQWLTKPSNELQTHITGTTLHNNIQTHYNSISLLSIVGHGGMGKTTLLQHIYKEEMKEEFDLKMWVCVSNNFDVKKVIADMLESHKNQRPVLVTLDALQKSLAFEVKSKKFLLVLDDIWEEEKEEQNKSKWENVLGPLASGKLGSKILVTTRMNSVASMIASVINKKNETLRLEGLKKDECLQLFNRYAFANVENSNVHHKLRSIAGGIVKKLSGSPLATRVLGGVLNSRLDESHWTRVLNSDFKSVESAQSVIMPILRLSYIFLPKHLQSCFAFCCIFPQDHRFDKDDLVRMWTALSFIQPPHEGTAKDTGERYFDVLIKKSLFDKFQINDKTYYKIHDLLHDMLRSVSTHECSNIVGDDEELVSKIPKTVRHLFVKTNNPGVIMKMEKFKNLHSLYLSSNNNNDNFVNTLDDIFKILRSIRLLYIHNKFLDQLPEKIGQLIHLRYLKIDESSVSLLPRSLSKLYHLQFMAHSLIMTKDLTNDFLPKDMNNLTNLQYLKLPFPGMHKIGKLNSLQELNGFYVKNESGYGIGELEDMNELRLLEINHLQNVNNVKEVCSAKLYEKKNLTDLYLSWHDSSPRNDDISDLQEKVLDKLQPYKNLKNLTIHSFMGAKSALWMNEFQMFSNMEYIKVKSCHEWKTLPPFGQLSSLKFLYLGSMSKTKRIDYIFHENDKDYAFPSLQVLEISNLQALEDWFDARAATDDRLFPCLTDLCLQNCPNLRELPSLPPKLKKLKIYRIGWKTLNWLKGTDNCCSISIGHCSNVISLSGLITEKCQLILNTVHINDPFVLLTTPLRSTASLENLSIEKNDAVVSFQFDVEQWFPTLCKLNFFGLKSLQSLPSSLESLSSLKLLEMMLVPQLQVLPNLPASLEKLDLYGLKSLQSLPSSLESLSSLKILEVSLAPQLQVLPNLPASLQELNLRYLESLQSLPSSLESLSSLKILEVDNVPQLQALPNLPASLEELHLYELKSLQSLPSSLQSLSSLKILEMMLVPQLQVLPNLPASLKKLDLYELKSLQSLPFSLESLSSLEILEVMFVPQLQVLPNLPASLEKLKHRGLESLQSLPSSLESISSIKILEVDRVPQLQVLPNLPVSLEKLDLYELESLQSLPSSLESLSSLNSLKVTMVPQLQVLPNLPASLEKLHLYELKSLQSLPSSLESLSSLKDLNLWRVPHLQVLPILPASLKELKLEELESLQSLPSSLGSLSSLTILEMMFVPQLQVLPNLPASLEKLHLYELKSLQSLPSSLESLSSLKDLNMWRVPQLQVLPNLPTSLKELKLEELESLQSLPSSLESLSSLVILRVIFVPRLQVLPNLPASLEKLHLYELKSLQSLPSSLDSLSSLKDLNMRRVPQLQVLPNLPSSLELLQLCLLESLDCLPSCLPSLSSLRTLVISDCPQLSELPDLPPSKYLKIRSCHSELAERTESLHAQRIQVSPMFRQYSRMEEIKEKELMQRVDNW